MLIMKTDEVRQRLHQAIASRAFVPGSDATIIGLNRTEQRNGWLFDLRRITLDATVLEDVGTFFWKTFEADYPFQIAGMETAAIPLVASLVTQLSERFACTDMSGFYMRKSRKKTGLTRMIEGDIKLNRPIVLVDDLMNTGKSLIRQVEVIESLGGTVRAVWVLLRFRDVEAYEYFTKRNITVHSVFSLNDFSPSLGVKNLVPAAPRPQVHPYHILWKFSGDRPSYYYVVPKSSPALDEERVFMGTDDGIMWALNQKDGSVAWSYKIASFPLGKGIFSSSVVLDGVVYFGAYDGALYALDAQTGKRRWLYLDADWIGSSPALAPELGLLFIGLEFGLWRKRGGIAAIDMTSGKRQWWYHEMPCLTHSSPLYIKKYQQVVIGSNDGACYLFDAKNGKLIWKCQTGTLTERDLSRGFSAHDIKGSFVYDEKRDLIIFGTLHGSLFFLKRRTGEIAFEYKADFGFYSSPVLHKRTILASSLDKHLYCIDLDTFILKWKWDAGARIFATPRIINDSVYIGANTGRLTELDPETGKERSFITLTERITNPPAYNPHTKRFFVPTFANELYCLEYTGEKK